MVRSRLVDERGAVLAITVLSLIALLGMTVLVVDVGGLMFRRVALQNSSDAAALAAAISCGTGEGTTIATEQAARLASEDSTGAQVATGYPKYSPSCDAANGSVTVRVTVDQQLFFAPVLTGGRAASVTTEATAAWGGAGTSEHVAPLMLSSHRLTDCDIPPPPEQDPMPTTCTFYWDNSSASGQNPNPALTNAEWGTLDLNMWNALPSDHCNQSVPTDFETWMFDGFDGSLQIDGDPTYVCRGQGNFGNAFDKLIEDAITADLFLYFPVNNPQKQIDKDGGLCPPGSRCSVDKYDIIGFARLQVTQLWSGKVESEASPCATRLSPAVTITANSRCMEAEWVGYTNGGLNPSGGKNFGVVPVTLTG